MEIVTKDNRLAFIRRLQLTDIDNLYTYLQNLSDESKSRFGPHKYDLQSLHDFYSSDLNLGYIAFSVDTHEIIAYAILKIGYLEHDKNRLESYGLQLSPKQDLTFAPSVTDAWQGCGVGYHLFNHIHSDLAIGDAERIILWGGVQMDNENAIKYYKRIGFETIGQFTYNGENYDMIYNLNKLEY
jgi:ribosomal protein S18 acetylase RimI-like enzyme